MTLILSGIEIRSHTLIPVTVFHAYLGDVDHQGLNRNLGASVPSGELEPNFNFYSCKFFKNSHQLLDLLYLLPELADTPQEKWSV